MQMYYSYRCKNALQKFDSIFFFFSDTHILSYSRILLPTHTHP